MIHQCKKLDYYIFRNPITFGEVGGGRIQQRCIKGQPDQREHPDTLMSFWLRRQYSTVGVSQSLKAMQKCQKTNCSWLDSLQLSQRIKVRWYCIIRYILLSILRHIIRNVVITLFIWPLSFLKPGKQTPFTSSLMNRDTKLSPLFWCWPRTWWKTSETLPWCFSARWYSSLHSNLIVSHSSVFSGKQNNTSG